MAMSDIVKKNLEGDLMNDFIKSTVKSQPAFTCSNSTMEGTPEQCVKPVQS